MKKLPGEYGLTSVVTKDAFDPQRALETDQILVGRNVTRRAYNIRMRERLGYTEPLPVAVRRRPADELAVAEYAEEDDVLAAEIRRRARVEVPQLLPDRRDESGYVVVDPFGERAPRAEVAAALHRPNLDHAPALRGCTKGPSSSVLSAVKRSS